MGLRVIPAMASDDQTIPPTWEKWCKSGKIKLRGKRKRTAVLKSMKQGHVRGYFSDMLLKPNLPFEDAMYPSIEHLIDPNNHDEIVVEARVFNDMRSILSEQEFWQVIEHFFVVGVQKGKIKPPFGKRLPKGWTTKRHFIKPIQVDLASTSIVATALKGLGTNAIT